jgi:histidinol phosphatase-like PHP family hydrolase
MSFLRATRGAEGFVIVIEPEDRYAALKEISEDNIIGTLRVDSVDLLTTKFVFEDKFKLKNYKIKIAKGSEIDSLIMDKNDDIDYTPFYNKYRKFGGFVTMSKIFTSADKNLGAIYVAVASGPLNGGGYFIYFDLSKKKVIVKTKSAWQA